MNNVMNYLLKALLIASAVVLAWMSYQSVMTPIEFNETREFREKQVVARLIDIRTAETEYRNLTGDYTASLDTLLNWVKTENAKIVLKEGVLTDKQLEEGMTEKEAVAYFAQLNKSGELADDELDNVAGGACVGDTLGDHVQLPGGTCPYCGANNPSGYYNYRGGHNGFTHFMERLDCCGNTMNLGRSELDRLIKLG